MAGVASDDARKVLAARRDGETGHVVEQYLKALRQRDVLTWSHLPVQL
ncbi:hypothetical protein [Actinophytocola sp.]